MNSSLQRLTAQYYDDFSGSVIVRNDQYNDAFEIAVFKILYGDEINFEISLSQINELKKFIIPPPDNSIDIVFPVIEGDSTSFDIVQVKSSSLSEKDIISAYTLMKETINNFCADPQLVKSDNCRTCLQEAGLDKSSKNNCRYYVVHTGTLNDFPSRDDKLTVINETELVNLLQNTSVNVKRDSLSIDHYMTYGFGDSKKAIICSLSGFDLALLATRYYKTDRGRNLLFGSNLRESLMSKKSKRYMAMKDTIMNNPDDFWFFNNGITIIADNYRLSDDKKTIVLNKFSIVNGAQTTSALGQFYEEMKVNNPNSEFRKIIDTKLKKVFVLTRILKISNEEMRNNIAIYNNSQNPINSRDMVSNSREQRHLHKWLLEGDPVIFVETRRGLTQPNNIKIQRHRIITNESLAQLACAAFLDEPYTAKDKKSSLFNQDFKSEYTVNQLYHRIFNYVGEGQASNGILFKKTKQELDEALFVLHLYSESKKIYKANIAAKIAILKKQLEDDSILPEQHKNLEKSLNQMQTYSDLSGICMYYFISNYFYLKTNYEIHSFLDTDKYWGNKDMRNEMNKACSDLFLSTTISVLAKTATAEGRQSMVDNWLRSPKCQDAFFSARTNQILEFDLEGKVKEFANKYMVRLSPES